MEISGSLDDVQNKVEGLEAWDALGLSSLSEYEYDTLQTTVLVVNCSMKFPGASSTPFHDSLRLFYPIQALPSYIS
jgi:hypothetical protein